MVNESIYQYMAGYSQPSSVLRNQANNYTSYDYRGRTNSVARNTRKQRSVRTKYEYVDNQLFKTIEHVRQGLQSLYSVNTFHGYSTDRKEVRRIVTRKPGISFPHNDAVMDANRSNADIEIHDAIRDLRGEIVTIIDPLGIETQRNLDGLARPVMVIRTGTEGTSLSSETAYDPHGKVLRTESETGLVTEMEYDDADNMITRTVADGTPAKMVYTYTYTIDSHAHQVNSPAEDPVTGNSTTATTTNVYETCCGFSRGVINALGHGTVTNQDSAGRSVHTAVVEDFLANAPNMLNPNDAATLSETTTRYYDNGQPQYRTVWKTAISSDIDRNNPPIAGVDGESANSGVTTQYLYDGESMMVTI